MLQILAKIANNVRLVFLEVDLLLVIRRFQDTLDAEELAATLADQLDLLAVVLLAHRNLMELQSLLCHRKIAPVALRRLVLEVAERARDIDVPARGLDDLVVRP